MTIWNTRIKIQYISDLHLEYKKFYPIINKLADNLALCGDIGYPHSDWFKQFIKNQCKNFKNVFFVLGNHDLYMKSNNKQIEIYTIPDIIKELERQDEEIPNFWFLNNSNIFIDRFNKVYREKPIDISDENLVNIIGTILWTDIDLNIAHRVNDYKKILIEKDKLLTPIDVKRMFQENVKFIQDITEKYPNNKTVLLTHHAPHHKLNGKYINGELQSAFSTDLSFLLKSPIKVAISGHVHSVCSFYFNDVFLASNEYGYSKAEETGYDAVNSFVEI